MDKIKRLGEVKDAIKSRGKAVRAQIKELADADSFVELSAVSFSEEGENGEGVVTGFATVGGYPFYIVAQNHDASYGGLTEKNCEKIEKALCAAEKNRTPVIYLLHSNGVCVKEGVHALEGIAKILLMATRLKGTLMQFAYLSGSVYGSVAALASVCDCIFFDEKSVLCVNSPFVLSAQANKNLKAEEVGGYAALDRAGLPAVRVSGLKEVASHIMRITDLVCVPVVDAELNAPLPALNKKADASAVCAVLEQAIELGADSFPEVKTTLARVGGIAVAAVVFDGVRLNEGNVRKIKNFVEFACCYGLPLVMFVDCKGVEASITANNSALMKEIAEYLNMLDATDTAKISVITGDAVGIGYSLFSAKSVGYDYVFAFATARIALFDGASGAEICYSGMEKGEAQLRYAEDCDPLCAARLGYLDDVIEPQFVRQYLVAALQTLIS